MERTTTRTDKQNTKVKQMNKQNLQIIERFGLYSVVDNKGLIMANYKEEHTAVAFLGSVRGVSQ